jgi:hypothetical protein
MLVSLSTFCYRGNGRCALTGFQQSAADGADCPWPCRAGWPKAFTEPFSLCAGFAVVQDVDGLGEVTGPVGAAAELGQDLPCLELRVRSFAGATELGVGVVGHRRQQGLLPLSDCRQQRHRSKAPAKFPTQSNSVSADGRPTSLITMAGPCSHGMGL